MMDKHLGSASCQPWSAHRYHFIPRIYYNTSIEHLTIFAAILAACVFGFLAAIFMTLSQPLQTLWHRTCFARGSSIVKSGFFSASAAPTQRHYKLGCGPCGQKLSFMAVVNFGSADLLCALSAFTTLTTLTLS